MIIFGYPGIGKTAIATSKEFKCHDLIDLDSRFFNVGDDPYWYKRYTNLAEYISSQGITVLVSTHSSVLSALKNSKERKIIICPDLSLKEKWIKRLDERRKRSNVFSDKKAYLHVSMHFDDDILGLMHYRDDFGYEMFLIDNMNYSFKDILKEIWEDSSEKRSA